MRRHRLLASILAAGLAFGTVGLTAVPAAEACMAVPLRPKLPDQKPTKIETAAAKFLFAQNGDEVTAHIQINYYGDAQDFSWVVPVPGEPRVSVGSDAVFSALTAATKPRFELEYKPDEGTCKQRPSSASGAPSASRAKAAPAAGAPAPQADVEVVTQRQVGPYESAVLKSDDPDALKKWLTENGYEVPAKLAPEMAHYVGAQYYFVALKLQQDRTSGDLQPIVLNYKAAKPGIPVRLASVAATPDMDVLVWVLGAHRAIPDNYNLTEINQARIDWMNKGDNYRQVVTEAMNESGGKAFVTDFAGKSSAVALPPFQASRYDLSRLEDQTDPVAFIKAFRELDFFEEGGIRGRTLAFLKRYVPRPATVATSVTDEAFYTHPEDYALEFTTASQTVDHAKAVQELDETVVAPKRDVGRLFSENPYLTAFYTTMSPEEMVDDPTFLFNPDMEDVKNVHRAEIRRQCSPNVYAADAPYKITLENNIAFLVAGREEDGTVVSVGGSGGKAVKIPAARRVMRCGTVGRPQTVNDLTSQITRSLNELLKQGVVVQIRTKPGATPSAGAGTTVIVTIPVEELLSSAASAAAGGFGCSGCSQMTVPPPPLRRGAGEGLTYALVLLGFLGYRGLAGRKKR